jgi:hypothetical protein
MMLGDTVVSYVLSCAACNSAEFIRVYCGWYDAYSRPV